MSYNTQETGAQTGAPVELYEFRHGPNYYRYTSADADMVRGTKTYEAVPLSRNSIEATQELARQALKISCAATLPILSLFRLAPPSDVITVTVYRMHRGDAESIIVWMGRILNVTWRGQQAEIHCESVHTSIKRPGLRRMYQKQCPHVLYSSQCGASESEYRAQLSVAGVSGLNVTVNGLSAFAAEYFAGGYIEWVNFSGVTERRAIRSSSGNVLVINFQPFGLDAGMSVDVYPGCDHTLATCANKFENSLNYGGMPYIPTKNPFGGVAVF
jgi:uncharacterized phage protein (TIGR02218 family)